jgi:hypothetical protein
METSVKAKSGVITDMKQRVSDIYLAVSWREIKRDYFKNGKSMSWFQHKMSGIDGNGGTGGFTQDEAEQLRNALFDLSDRIRRAANNIEAPVAFKPI